MLAATPRRRRTFAATPRPQKTLSRRRGGGGGDAAGARSRSRPRRVLPQAPGAEKAFKRVSAAFATLRDPRLRRQHDVFGSAPPEQRSAGSGGFTASAFGDQDAEELFKAMFGDGDGATGGDDTSVVASVAGVQAMARRLLAVFRANPWTLVTALSFVASAWNVLSSLHEKLGNRLFVVIPGLGVAWSRPDLRRTALLTTAAIALAWPRARAVDLGAAGRDLPEDEAF